MRKLDKVLILKIKMRAILIWSLELEKLRHNIINNFRRNKSGKILYWI